MKIVKEFIVREIAGECVMVPTGETTQEFNGLITLTESARYIWEHLEEAESLGQLIEMITDTYEIDRETAVRETVGFIDQLLQAGFIDCTREDRTW